MINALGAPQSLLLLGGTSEIGLALAERLVRDRCHRVVLAARPSPAREEARDRLTRLGAEVRIVDFDAHEVDGHAAVVTEAFDGGDIDLTVLAFGLLGDQERAERDAAHAVELATVNYVGGVSALVHLAERLRGQGHGTIAVLSSVAAQRPRRANFAYGSAKAGLDAFATGLGDALHGTGVRVLVVRPGFVATKMTAHLPPAPMSTTPDAVAAVIVDALHRGSETVWAPPRLRLVMTALSHVPRALFRRLPR